MPRLFFPRYLSPFPPPPAPLSHTPVVYTLCFERSHLNFGMRTYTRSQASHVASFSGIVAIDPESYSVSRWMVFFFVVNEKSTASLKFFRELVTF